MDFSSSNHQVQEKVEEKLSFDELQAVADFIRKSTSIVPEFGIICGSGLGGLAEHLESKTIIPYKDIPNFPQCKVKGHAGNLVFGKLSDRPVVCMQGRFHYYEGYPPWKITMPVRVMSLLGVKVLIVTNAAGGLNEGYSRGDIMVVRDHINMVGLGGNHPLIGENEERFGLRFPPMTNAYDREFRKVVKKLAGDLDMSGFVREGVYVCVSGPSYETPSESVFLRQMGADAVGMSTAPEVVVANHCGMRVLGLSLVTNAVIMDHESEVPEPTHQEVMETANKRAKDMETLVKEFLRSLPG